MPTSANTVTSTEKNDISVTNTDLFVGVDGGASKCHVRLEDAYGTCLGQSYTGPASVKLSPEGAWQSIMTGLRDTLKQAQLAIDLDTATSLSPHIHIGCGLTGSELPDACSKFIANTPPCFATTCLNSDAYTACLGAHNGKDGSIIIIGTGVVSLQIQRGKTVRVGGWGFPHGDEGSAAWLGLEAVRLTFHWLDGRFTTNDDQLLTAIFHKFDDDLTKLVVWANNANSTAFAKIAPLVIEYTKEQDALAVKLMQRAAQHIDCVGEVLAQYTEAQESLPCALLGGMVPFVAPYLCAELRSRLVPPQHDAAVGAILMVKNKLAADSRSSSV